MSRKVIRIILYVEKQKFPKHKSIAYVGEKNTDTLINAFLKSLIV